MTIPRVVIVGGGASGFFAAIACAESAPGAEIVILEKGPRFLSKVLVSGGGRCNVTNACFDTRQLCSNYPRGGRALAGPFHQFQPRDTMDWFVSRGIELRTEPGGRVFPATDSSRTIAGCLERAAVEAGVKLCLRSVVKRVETRSDGRFEVLCEGRQALECDCVLLAVGGCRSGAEGGLATALGHTLESPVPSLFTLDVQVPWVQELSGVSVADAALFAPEAGLRERGAILLTHWGVSGPAVLRLSAWGARDFHSAKYQFPLRINWLPGMEDRALDLELESRRASQPARQIAGSPVAPLTGRLWGALVAVAGIAPETRWAGLSSAARHQLIRQLTQTELMVTGKSANKDEFVTCGGVSLREVNLKTMESRICRGLYFSGELLDIDGVTGGFNFQAAWTTGWIAGRSMAAALMELPGRRE
jgi:predicted Rossmann fold flavoprotein